MEKVFSSPNLTMVYHLKNVLDIHEMECIVLGEYRRSAVGEIPPHEAWIELWVLDDWRVPEALKILEDATAPAETELEPWRCPKCGEKLEGQFDQCWKCGAGRPK